jgi:hypothetical protein
MAITRLGLGGSSAAYPGFSPKAVQITVPIHSMVVITITATSTVNVSVVTGV